MFSRIRLALMGILVWGAVGCTPGQSPGPGNPPNGSDVVLDMGSNGVFEVGADGIASSERVFDISANLPAQTPTRASILLDAADICVGTSMDVGTSGVVVVELRLAADVSIDACETGTPQTPIVVQHRNDRVTGIAPVEVEVNTNGLVALLAGRFGLCFSVSTTEPRRVQIDRLSIRFPESMAVVANSCAEIVALPQVQNALTGLAASSIRFAVPTGSQPADIVDSYVLTEETTFDPDGNDVGRSQNSSIVFSDQRPQTVERSGFDSSVTQFIVGDATSVGLCTLSRTNDPLCDQTIARLESLQVDPATGDLGGQFLSVAVRRHRNSTPSCGATGDFIFGDVTFVSQSGVSQPDLLARHRGKVAVTPTVTPDLLLLSPSEGTGVYSDVGSGAVTQFDTSDPFASRPVVLPQDLSPLGTSALGYSSTGAMLAVVTDRPDATVSYDGTTLQVIRQTASTTADYIGETVDFDSLATRIYVPTTSPDFTDRVTILRTDDGVFADEVRRMPTPGGSIPVFSRVSPDGSLMATLFESGAPIGQAGEFVLANIDRVNPNFILPVIDLVTDAGGTVLAQQLVYSQDGSQLFLAGLGAVIAIQTVDPFAITRIDVSGGANDSPVALALSGDGNVLAVAVDDELGSVNFALVDTATRQVVHTTLLPGITRRGAVDVAHFETGRVAIVANVRDQVVAIQTVTPFAFSNPLSVADVTDRNSVGRMAASGSIIAVSNVDEPAIYLFEFPTPPQ